VRLDGLRIVVDCANGAAYQVAPGVMWELGAEVDRHRRRAERQEHQRQAAAPPISMLACKETVRETSGADIGIALDGDADRLIVVDEKGQIVDGDQIMALIGTPTGGARRSCAAAAWWRR
jgi:phosphoglucosamine mutase